MYSHSQSPELENLYCSKCSTFIAKTEYLSAYEQVYCSSCWEHMKQTYLKHITDLTREITEKDETISDLEESLAESEDIALGGSGGR